MKKQLLGFGRLAPESCDFTAQAQEFFGCGWIRGAVGGGRRRGDRRGWCGKLGGLSAETLDLALLERPTVTAPATISTAMPVLNWG